LKTNIHKVLSLTIDELLHPFLMVITLHVHFHKKLYRAWLAFKNCSRKRKLLLVKYIYKKQQIKNGYNKRKILPSISNAKKKKERIAGVRGNKIVNMFVLVLHIRLWLSHKMLKHHMLNIYILPIQPPRHTTIWHPSKPPHPFSLEASSLSFAYIFGFSFAPRTKNHAAYIV
jgi:hypothetical protein